MAPALISSLFPPSGRADHLLPQHLGEAAIREADIPIKDVRASPPVST
jgi:hypothetical protein